MIGQHNAFAQFAADDYAYYGWQESPVRAAMYVKYVKIFSFGFQSEWKDEPTNERCLCAEYLGSVSVGGQHFLQNFHLSGDASDPRFVITYQEYLHAQTLLMNVKSVVLGLINDLSNPTVVGVGKELVGS